MKLSNFDKMFLKSDKLYQRMSSMRQTLINVGTSCLKISTDGEKIAATKAWLAIPPDVEMPKSYVNFCRVVGVDTIGKRLELAEATKVQEMKEKQTAIKQEK